MAPAQPALTADQFNALAELMTLRPRSASYQAARAMLVDGLSAPDAARAVGMPYADAWKALKRATRALALARAAST